MLSQEHFDARKSGIGGSDVAAIMGLSTYKSPLDVYLDKMGKSKPKEETEPMHWGNVLEAPVADEFAKQSNLQIANISVQNYEHFVDKRLHGHVKTFKDSVEVLLFDPVNSFLLASIDRLWIDGDKRGVLEIKTTSKHYMSGWKYDIPLEFYCQAQHYMLICTGLGIVQKDSPAYIAILASGQSFSIVPVEPDFKFQEKMVEACKKFWNENIIPKNMPEPSDGAGVEKVYPAIAGKELEASKEVAELVKNLHTAQTKIKDLTSEEAQLKDQIKVIMKDSEILTHKDDLLVTWKKIESNKLNSKELKLDYPELVEQYMKVSEYRQFLCKLKGGE